MSSMTTPVAIMTMQDFQAAEHEARYQEDDPIITIVKDTLAQWGQAKCGWCQKAKKLHLGNFSFQHLDRLANTALKEADFPLQVSFASKTGEFKIQGEYPNSQVVLTKEASVQLKSNDQANATNRPFKLELNAAAIAQKAKHLIHTPDSDKPSVKANMLLTQIQQLIESYSTYPQSQTLHDWRIDIPPKTTKATLNSVVQQLEKKEFSVKITSPMNRIHDNKVIVRQQLIISVSDQAKETDATHPSKGDFLAHKFWTNYTDNTTTRSGQDTTTQELSINDGVELFNTELQLLAVADPQARLFAFEMPSTLDHDSFISLVTQEYQVEIGELFFAEAYHNVLPATKQLLIVELGSADHASTLSKLGSSSDLTQNDTETTKSDSSSNLTRSQSYMTSTHTPPSVNNVKPQENDTGIEENDPNIEEVEV